MIKIYGMDTCPDCSYLFDQIRGREDEFEYISIGEHVRNLKEFLRIRDNSPVFDDCKASGYDTVYMYCKIESRGNGSYFLYVMYG